MQRSWALAVVLAIVVTAVGRAQEPAPEPAPEAAPVDSSEAWWFDVAAAGYFIPEEEDFVQPTIRADHGRLHLEARHNYEDRDSVSAFAGGTFELGDELAVTLTPMIGGVTGNTDGIIPAVEADLTAAKLEAYAEAEYLFDLGDSSSSYFYMWSELSFWPTDWLRAGLVGQRTRVYQTERDIQRGLLVGLTAGRVDGAVYYFNPGADDHFLVVSLGVSF